MKIPSEMQFTEYLDLVRQHINDPAVLREIEDPLLDTDEIFFIEACQERDILPEDCAADLEYGTWVDLAPDLLS